MEMYWMSTRVGLSTVYGLRTSGLGVWPGDPSRIYFDSRAKFVIKRKRFKIRQKEEVVQCK